MKEEEVVVVETIQALKGKKKELKSALSAIVPICRRAKGCLQYDLLEPAAKGEDEFLVLMRWERVEDLRLHESSSYIENFVLEYEGVLYGEVSVTEWKNSAL